MATSHTHPHPQMPHHIRPHDAKPRPHTHPHLQAGPALLPRDVSSTEHQPLSWSPSPRPSGPPLSLEHKGHHSLPDTPAVHMPPQHSATSVATLENARYRLGEVPRSEHPNEDRHFVLENDDCKVFGVFDGHDGPRAAGFASNYFIEYFSTESWRSIISLPPSVQRKQIPMALTEFFKAAEKEFFKSIRSSIEEKKQLQRTIPSVSYTMYTL